MIGQETSRIEWAQELEQKEAVITRTIALSLRSTDQWRLNTNYVPGAINYLQQNDTLTTRQ